MKRKENDLLPNLHGIMFQPLIFRGDNCSFFFEINAWHQEFVDYKIPSFWTSRIEKSSQQIHLWIPTAIECRIASWCLSPYRIKFLSSSSLIQTHLSGLVIRSKPCFQSFRICSFLFLCRFSGPKDFDKATIATTRTAMIPKATATCSFKYLVGFQTFPAEKKTARAQILKVGDFSFMCLLNVHANALGRLV